MITLCIRYTIDPNKLAEFEAYARSIPVPAQRCGAKGVSYYLPTKFAGPTNAAIGFIDFPSLGAYEQYRDRLAKDPEAAEAVRRIEATGTILVEDRAILRPVTATA